MIPSMIARNLTLLVSLKQLDHCSQLSETNQRVLDGKEELRIFQEHTEENNNKYKSEIDRLTAYATDFDHLKKLSEDQEKEIVVLSKVRQEKIELEEEFEQLQKDLGDEQNQNVNLTKTIREMNVNITSLEQKVQDGLQREEKNNVDNNRLESENNELKLLIIDKKEKIRNLNDDLGKSRNEVTK